MQGLVWRQQPWRFDAALAADEPSVFRSGGDSMVTQHARHSGVPWKVPSMPLIMLVKIGEPCRARTCDLLIKSQLLYQLS